MSICMFCVGTVLYVFCRVLSFCVLCVAEMVERRVEVVARLKALEEAAAPLVTFLQNPNAVGELRAERQYNLQMLSERYQVCTFDLTLLN